MFVSIYQYGTCDLTNISHQIDWVRGDYQDSGRGRGSSGRRSLVNQLMQSMVAGALEKLSAPLCAHVQVKITMEVGFRVHWKMRYRQSHFACGHVTGRGRDAVVDDLGAEL